MGEWFIFCVFMSSLSFLICRGHENDNVLYLTVIKA